MPSGIALYFREVHFLKCSIWAGNDHRQDWLCSRLFNFSPWSQRAKAYPSANNRQKISVKTDVDRRQSDPDGSSR